MLMADDDNDDDDHHHHEEEEPRMMTPGHGKNGDEKEDELVLTN